MKEDESKKRKRKGEKGKGGGSVKEESQGGEAEGRETAWRKIRGKGGQKCYDEVRTQKEGEDEGIQYSVHTKYINCNRIRRPPLGG
jgi:hypothetical protein